MKFFFDFVAAILLFPVFIYAVVILTIVSIYCHCIPIPLGSSLYYHNSSVFLYGGGPSCE